MNHTPDRIGIEFISVFGLPPVEFVAVAADLGCRHISIALAPMQSNPHNYPAWSLREEKSLRRDLVAVLRERDVSISLGEGFLIRPGADMRDAARDLDTMHELAVTRVNILALDPDLPRSLDQLAAFAAMAADRGMDATVEFLPGLVIGDLAAAVAAARHVGKPNFSVLVDAMHFFRSGSSLTDLSALDASLIGYAQLCDVPLVSKHESYGKEARENRLPPGKGELPLPAFVAALPPSVIVGLEVPMADQALAGIGPRERLAGCVAATRELLGQVAS